MPLVITLLHASTVSVSRVAAARAFRRHRWSVVAIGVFATLFMLLTVARPSEARGAPRWISHWARAVMGRAQSEATVGDTTVVFGPKTFSLGTATSATFVERFTASDSLTTGSGYMLHLVNGPDGAAAVTGGTVSVNGTVVANSTALAGVRPGGALDIPIALQASDTLVAQLTGPTGSALKVTVLAAPNPTFLVFGPRTYERASGAPVDVTEHFSLPAGAAAPTWLVLRNGDPDGSRRVSSATVKLNGVLVIGTADLNQQVAGYRLRVPLQQDNVLEVQLNTDPGVRLTISALATDSAPPVIAVTAPASGVITNATTLNVVGAVDDQTAVRITVNGAAATVSQTSATRSSFTASVPLSIEGNNHITVSAVDAAGNRTDSVRTVLRDTEAPVVTLNGLPDSMTYRPDTVLTLSGTITDRTAITANVNGIPLVIDSVSHAFSQRVALVRGVNFLTLTATDAAGNTSTLVRQVTRDDVPPTLALNAPAVGFVTRDATVHVAGTVTDASPLALTVNGVASIVAPGGTFANDVPLVVGSNALSIVATDAAGNQTKVDRTIVRDIDPPVVTMSSPSDGVLVRISTVSVRGTVVDASAVTATLNGVPLTLGADGSYASTIALIEGTNILTLVATDAAGNATTITRSLTLDTTAPVLGLTSPTDGSTVAADVVTVTGTATDVNAVKVTVNGSVVPIAAGAFTTTVPLVVGPNSLTIVATDSAGNSSTLVRSVTRSASTDGLPPDPRLVATPLSRTIATPFVASTAFLYSGQTPIQTGVDSGTISPVRVAVLRGRLITRDGAPLPGVRVTVLNHPELGATLSRADGWYDLAVNGGPELTVDFQKKGYLPSQRHTPAPMQDYSTVATVALVPLDTASTVIDFTQPAQVARGSIVTDSIGTRQATLLFAQGTQASFVMPDGSERAAGSLTIRATEFTVGSRGPLAMPASLPPLSAYTWAADFSADEALAVGATSVKFDKPVVILLENYRGFSVGETVPAGYYDRQKGLWIATENGRIIKVLDTASGIATLDVDGTGTPASPYALSQLGITNDELQRIAELYRPGQTLSRIRLSHFTPCDENWPYKEPDGAGPPKFDPIDPERVRKDKQREKCGSIIGCDRQTLGERIDIPGTGLSLNYSSERTPGYRRGTSFDIPITGAEVPANVEAVIWTVSVAGRQFADTLPPLPNQSKHFEWDGKDAYGREVLGGARLTVTLSYAYFTTYGWALEYFRSLNAFGMYAGESRPLALPWDYVVYRSTTLLDESIGEWDARAEGLGGWTLSAKHAYDPNTRTLYRGDGNRSNSLSFNTPVVRAAGTGVAPYYCTSDCTLTTPRAATSLPVYAGAMAADAEGGFYIDAYPYIRHVTASGLIEPFAGNGTTTSSGDGGPASQAGFRVGSMAMGADGSLYFTDNHTRIRRIDPAGIITTFAGDGTCGDSGDGGPIAGMQLCTYSDLALGPDGSIYFSQSSDNSERLRRIGPDSTVSTILGFADQYCVYGSMYPCAENVRAATAKIGSVITSVAAGPDGSIYVGDNENLVIWRIAPDGILHRFAGDPTRSPYEPLSGDGGQARDAVIGNSLTMLHASPTGDVYMIQSGLGGGSPYGNKVIRRIAPNGIITTIAGLGGCGAVGQVPCYAGDGRAARMTSMYPNHVITDAGGHLLLGDAQNYRVRRLEPALPGYTASEFVISSDDGHERYRFDQFGRQLSTQDALTGRTTTAFSYDSSGNLVALTDATGDTVRIERDGSGAPTAIVSPYGLRTTLAIGSDGYLSSVTAPASGTTSFTYGTGGLLESMVDPNQAQYSFSYADLGMLQEDKGPDGARTTLSATNQPAGSQLYENAATSALGRTTVYRGETLRDGSFRTVTTAPNGAQAIFVQTTRDSTTQLAPDGTSVFWRTAADPRQGQGVPLAQQTIVTLPSGLTATIRQSRTLTLVDSLNPGSALLVQLDSVIRNGSAVTRTYDATANTVTTKSAEGRIVKTTLDSLGRPVTLAVPGVAATRRVYDDRGRLHEEFEGTSRTVFDYDSLGNLARVTDPSGAQAVMQHDAAGRIVSITSPLSITDWNYDATGRLASLGQRGGATHRFTYTLGGKVASYVAPAIAGQDSVTRYSYTLDGEIERIMRPDGLVIAYSYDAAGRPFMITQGNDTTTFAYALSTGLLTQAGVTGEGGTLTLAYDGSLLTRTVVQGIAQADLRFGYDANFRPTMQVVSGDSVQAQYDHDGLLTQIGALALRRSTDAGRLLGATVGAVTEVLAYDTLGVVTGDTTSISGAPLFAYRLERDVLKRIIARVETIGGSEVRYDFAYDSASRLAEVRRDGTVVASYSYDANGNRLTTVTPAGVVAGTYDAQDRLLSYGDAQYGYTAAGELRYKAVGNDTTWYTYDVRGNLRAVSLPDGTRIEYVADAMNRRVARKVNGVVTQRFVYAGALGPAAEVDANGAVITRFVYGTHVNVPDYFVRGGVTYRVVTDYLGSVRLIVNATTGEVAQRLDYDAYGQVLQNTNPGFQPFGYAGGLLDEATGLVRFGARDYESMTGRFTSKDRLRFGGGDSNLYRYVRNDPANRADPSGLGPLDDPMAAIRTLILAAQLVVATPGVSEILTHTRQASEQVVQELEQLKELAESDQVLEGPVGEELLDEAAAPVELVETMGEEMLMTLVEAEGPNLALSSLSDLLGPVSLLIPTKMGDPEANPNSAWNRRKRALRKSQRKACPPK